MTPPDRVRTGYVPSVPRSRFTLATLIAGLLAYALAALILTLTWYWRMTP